MSLKSKKKKTAVSPLVRGSAAAGAAAQARAKKSTVKQSVQKAAAKIQPAKAAASKAPVAKKKTTATSASGRNDAAVRQSYGQRAGTRTSSGTYKPTQSAVYNYKKAETKRSTISTDIKKQTKVKNQKPSVVSGPVKESRDNRDARMRQSWSQRHPENHVQREQRNEKQRPKSYVPTKGMATPTTKNIGKKSEWAEFEEGYNKAGILSPNERTGIAQGPLKDRAPLNTSQAKDIDTMLSGGTVPGMYIPDDKKPSALEYNIRMTGKDALSKPYAEEIWKNASVSEKARILKAATETVGFNVQTRRWSDEFQREYGLTSSDEKVKILGQGKPGVGELMYRDAYDKYKSAVKQQEYVDKWAKDHGYGTSDYMADATNLATATTDVGLMNLSYLPLKDITNIERKPGDYFLGGVKAPYEGVSSNKSAFQNLATISNNIVGSVRSIIELPFKGAYYGINKINPDADRYVDDFIATHNNVDRINRDRDEMIMRMNSAVNAGLVGKKSQVAGNIEGFILQQIPAIATMIAAGPEASSLIGSTTFFGTTAGAYAQSALDSGASLEEAMNYGILGGIGEGATEMIFPMAKGIGGGLLKGGANTVNKRVLFGETVRELEKSGFANSMSGRILRSTIYNGGEATEEMIMEIIDPYLQRASFNPEAENASLAEIGMAGLYGAAVSAVLHIPMGMMNTAQGLTERHGLISNARLYYAAKMREELIAIRGSLEAGMITEEEAEQRTKEVRDKFATKFAEAKTAIKQPWKATGSLLNEQTQGGEFKTSSNLEHLYSNRQEANTATVKPGTSAYFMEDGEVKRITHSEAGVKSEDAVLTNSEKTAYAEKAERLRTAKNNTERTGVQANVRQDIIDQASEMARVYNRNVEFYRDEEAAKRYDDRGRFDPKTETIYVNAATDKPLQTIISHEMVHAMRNTNAFKELLREIKTYYKDSYDADINDIRRMYSERDENGNVIEPSEGIIQEEVVAHFVEKKLLTDEAWVNTFLTNSRTDKILRGINTLLQRGLGGKEARFLASVRSKWLNALEEERGEQTAPRAEAVAAAKERRQAKGNARKKPTVDERKEMAKMFARNVSDWDNDGRPNGDLFVLTYTGDVLQGLGAIESDIYMRSKKINDIMKDHPEMGIDEFKMIPKILNDPILILESKNTAKAPVNTRLVILGEEKFQAKNKKPVTVVLDIYPHEKNLYLQEYAYGKHKAVNAFGRDNIKNVIQSSNVLYIDENKKRTDSLFGSLGFQLPTRPSRIGSIGSITYDDDSVNIRGEKFSDIVSTGDEVRRAFGGVRARTADTSLLAKAKEMKEEGRSDEDILKETGWYVGADGQWRFEIDDSEFKFNSLGFSENEDDREYTYLSQKEYLSRAEEKRRIHLFNSYAKPAYYLDEYVKHKKLFDAYPELKKISVNFITARAGYRGSYNESNNAIYLNRTLSEGERRETLIHEIQHAIQGIEGFASGASPEYWSRRDSDAREDLARRQNSIIESLSDEDYRKYSEYTGMKRIVDGWIDVAGNLPVEEVIPDDETYNIWKQTAEESDRLYEELKEKDWFDELMELDEFLENPSKLHYNLYRNTAGEIEARDATNRLPLTAEERRNKMPDRGDEKTVFVEDVRSAKGSRDAEYLSAVERGDMETAQRLVDEAAEEAGYTYHLYHGTNAEFTAFDVRKFGGKNGKGEGYGIYLASNRTIAEPYGKNLIESYVNFNRLAEEKKRTLKYAEVRNLIKKSCELEAKQFVEDEEYDTLEDALRDTWVSNYVYTYDYQDMNQVYADVTDIILQGNENDADIINEIMLASGAHYDYDSAMDFYDEILTPETGIDGFHYIWGEDNDVYLAFRSSQIKRADPVTRDKNGKIILPSERFNENKDDIRWAKGKRKRDPNPFIYKMYRAEQMEKQGYSEKDIVEETGWYKRKNKKDKNPAYIWAVYDRLSPDKKYDFSKSFAQQIDDYLQGKFHATDTFLVGDTPELLQKIGLDDLPVTLGIYHVLTAINYPEGHHFMIEEIKKLPEAIEKPLAVIRSTSENHENDSVVMIVKLGEQARDVIPIRISGNGVLNGKRIKSNAITTFYSNDELQSVLNNAVEKYESGENSIFFFDAERLKNEANYQMERAGSITSGRNHMDGFINNIIGDYWENVKSAEENRSAKGQRRSSEAVETAKYHTKKLKYALYNRDRADNKELWDMLRAELNKAYSIGAYDPRVAEKIIDFAYRTGYQLEDNGNERFSLREKISIPEEYRGEMESLGGLAAVNRSIFGTGTVFTYKNNGITIDEAYDEARDMRPDLFPETDNPSEQVQNIVDALTKVSDKIPLEEIDRAEDNPFEDSGDPIYNEIRDAVIAAMDDIATIGRIDMVNRAKREGKNLSAKAQYRKGRESGKKQGQRSGYNTAKREQDRTDRATMREFDKLERQRAIDRAKQENQDRRDDEATMREFDNVMKKVRQDERKLSQQEKKELRKNYESREKDIRAEKNRLIHRLRVEKRSWQDAAERMESERKKQQRSLDTKQRQEMRKKQQKLDEERREERLYAALDAYEERKAEEKKGSAESLYKRNREVQSIIDDFRTRVLQVAARMGAFKKEGSLLLDHNDVAIAKTDDGFDYHLYRDKNVVPSFALTVLAEHEGMKKEDFYGVYAELQRMQNERNEKGVRVYSKRDILDYIVSLDISAKHKTFLYFDVMKYAYDKKPVFKDGGSVKVKPGNYYAGDLAEAIDRVGLDMFSGAGVQIATGKTYQIGMEDVEELLDLIFTDPEMKDVFRPELIEMITDFESDIEAARMLEQTNLLTDNPKEVDSMKNRIIGINKEFKRSFLAEGEAFERLADIVKNPLVSARYYAAKAANSIARDYINGHGIRSLSGEKGKGLSTSTTKKNGDVTFKDKDFSLNNIMKAALKGTKESDALLKDLTLYVYARHNIDRMQYDKGFMELSVEECREIVDELGKNQEIVEMADNLVEYGQRLLQLCVESGMISQEDYDYFTTKYPHYVPTFRLREDEVFDRNGNVVRRTNKVIKEATKSNADMLPLYDQMVRRTQEIVKACKKNQLANELVKVANKDGAWDFIIDVKPAEPTSGDEDYIYMIGQIEDRGLKNRDTEGEDNYIPVYINGVKYNIEAADKNLLYGWDRLNYYRDEGVFLKTMRGMNNLRRYVLTQYNPVFWATNGIKDSIDMYLYNQHAHRLPRFQAKAFTHVFTPYENGRESFAEYLSFGAASASFFDYDERRRSKAKKAKDYATIGFKAIDAFNFMVEQWPRYTVYLEETDRLTKERKKGKNEYTDEEIKTIAAYRAADATVNFGRSGTAVKAANSYGVTFLNAGVQGMDRFRRMFTQCKGETKRETLLNVIGISIKLAAVGLAPSMLMDWLYGGDDDDEENNALLKLLYGDEAAKVVQEYSEMADYERINYLNIRIPGHEWMRIPKGRVVSFIYGFDYNGQKVLSGDMSAMDMAYAQWELFADNIMPGNPLTSNIIQPLLEAKWNRDFWGNEIVSQWADAGDGFHWTETNEDTSTVAEKAAEWIHKIVSRGKEMSPVWADISPVKIDYILQQYLGSWNNIFQPFISAIGDGQDQRFVDMIQDALKDSMWGKFYLDPVMSNRLAGDYYDLQDEYNGLSEYYDQNTPYAVAAKVFKDHNEDLKALRAEMNFIAQDASLTWAERRDKMREIREQMNDIYRSGVLDAKALLTYAGDIYGGKEMNKDIYDGWQADTKGPDWVISHMSDSAQGKWSAVKDEYAGADPQNFVDTYNYFSGLKGDKDENGKTVRDSKRQKFISWLDDRNMSAAEKQIYYKAIGGYKTEATFTDGGSGTTKSNKDALKEKAEEIQANAKYMPVKEARISSEFGMRDHPISGKRKMHNGIDIAVGTGTDVVSARKGVVEFAGSRGGYGNRVVIDHGDGMKTTYSHLSEIGVKEGDTVNAGTLIAKSGDTGGVTGPHLHFEVEVNGSYVNPRDFFDFDSWKTVSIAKNPDYSAYAPTKSSGGGGGGGGRKSGGKKSGGGKSGGSAKATSSAKESSYEANYVTTPNYSSGSSGSSGSGKSSGSTRKEKHTQTSVASTARGVMLPTARELSTYQRQRTSQPTASSRPKSTSHGVMLPTAAEIASAASGAKIGYGSGTSSIRRTNRSRGSFWHENVLG